MDQEKYKKLLLEKFFQKNLSRDERHELERFALDDPFLFEALEGFTEVKGSHASDIERLKSKPFVAKKNKKRSFIPYGIAASLLLLVSVSVWTLGTKSNMASEKTFAEAKKEQNVELTNTSSSAKSAPMNNDDQVAVDQSAGQVAINVVEEEEVETELSNEILKDAKESVEPVSDYAQRSRSENENQNQNENGDLGVISPPMTSAPPEPRLEEEEAVVFESVTEEKVVEQSSKNLEADVDDASNVLMNTNKAKRAESSLEDLQEAVVLDGVRVSQSPFEDYFSKMLDEEFNSRELRQLKKNVVVEFDLVNSAVANFKTTPNQSSEMNVRLLEIVKKGLEFLPSDGVGYRVEL